MLVRSKFHHFELGDELEPAPNAGGGLEVVGGGEVFLVPVNPLGEIGAGRNEGAIGVRPDPLVAVGHLVGQPRGQGATDVGQFSKVKLLIEK